MSTTLLDPRLSAVGEDLVETSEEGAVALLTNERLRRNTRVVTFAAGVVGIARLHAGTACVPYATVVAVANVEVTTVRVRARGATRRCLGDEGDDERKHIQVEMTSVTVHYVHCEKASVAFVTVIDFVA